MTSAPSRPIVAHRSWRPRGATLSAWLTGLACVAALFSIAASQTLLAAALASLLFSRQRLSLPVRWSIPLLAFAGWTLLSLAFSSAPVAGLPQVRKLFIFFLLPLAASSFQSQRQVLLTVQGVLLGGVVAALYGIAQFVLKYQEIQEQGAPFYENYVVHQITGFMGHWMTFGGQLMLVFLLWLGMGLFDAARAQRLWKWPGWAALGVIGLALLGAFTRGIWLGTLAGATYLVFRFRRGLVALIPVVVLLIYLFSPSWLQQRNESILSPQDSSSMSRIVMLEAGLNMVREHPIFGLGPERIGPEFENYVAPGAALPPAWYGHLHNSFLQIAAERGIPCLIILLWLFYEVLREHVAGARKATGKEQAFRMGAVAATIGIMVSGLFEYNLGDSEVLMLYFFVIAVPLAWTSTGTPDAAKQRVS